MNIHINHTCMELFLSISFIHYDESHLIITNSYQVEEASHISGPWIVNSSRNEFDIKGLMENEFYIIKLTASNDYVEGCPATIKIKTLGISELTTPQGEGLQ